MDNSFQTTTEFATTSSIGDVTGISKGKLISLLSDLPIPELFVRSNTISSDDSDSTVTNFVHELGRVIPIPCHLPRNPLPRNSSLPASIFVPPGLLFLSNNPRLPDLQQLLTTRVSNREDPRRYGRGRRLSTFRLGVNSMGSPSSLPPG